jgi:hypothetical protein
MYILMQPITLNHVKSFSELNNEYETMCEEKMKRNQQELRKYNKKQKVSNENMQIPEISQQDVLLENNYNLQQLKIIAKQHKLKVTGNKQQLNVRIYTFLFLSGFAIRIQKVFRGHLQRKFNSLRGPGWKNKNACTNSMDFLSMDLISELPNSQFFSYQDNDGFIYAFDTISMYNLIYKSTENVARNPYNRNEIPPKVVYDFRHLMRIGRIMKCPILTQIKTCEEEEALSATKHVELKIVDIFQKIDALGNYTNPKWFMDLSSFQIFRFIRFLLDIWQYRAHLTEEMKRNICPPHGFPFGRYEFPCDLDVIRKKALSVIEKMVTSANDKDNQCLGAYFVLGALTLVSDDAANAMPHLYHAFQL